MKIGCELRIIGGMSQAILRRRELSKHTKLRVVNAMVLPVGCDTLALWKEQRPKIQASPMNALRRIEGACWKDESQTRRFCGGCMGQVGVLDMVKKRQDEWEGRLEKMGSERCNKRAFEGVVEGRRPRGRPIKMAG